VYKLGNKHVKMTEYLRTSKYWVYSYEFKMLQKFCFISLSMCVCVVCGW